MDSFGCCTAALEEGTYLTRHSLVDRIHVTGATSTHDAIVFGTGPDAAARKAADDPVIDTPVTSELGGVGPTIVVGGEWSAADLRYQAEHIISQKLHNHGFNCVACQILVLPESWNQADDLLERDAIGCSRSRRTVGLLPGCHRSPAGRARSTPGVPRFSPTALLR